MHSHKEQVEEFLTATMENRLLQERDRDYYDHKQWTEAQIATLRKRNQAAIVVNRVKPKVEGLIGLYIMRHTDPKAYPRTKKHEKSANAITDALNFVADNNDFENIKAQCAESFWIEGVTGAIVDVRQNNGDEIEIRIEEIPFDRIYYDPHSRKKDFSDARYKGMVMWMGEAEIIEKFPDADIDQILSQASQDDEWAFEDRPRWVDRKERRARIVMHYYLEKGVWWMHIFAGDYSLAAKQESPFLDEFGKPACPIELVSANVDRDNNRYGEVRGFIGLQDEINHRRSKALHLLSQRQTFGRKGDKHDVAAVKRELAKPEGHIEFTGQEFGKDFGILPTNDMAAGQVQMYLDSKAELDAVSINAQLSGERQSGDLSGRAIDKLQSAGALELNRQYGLLAGWEKRIYRQVWARIKQFWTEEKWVRVTDDQDNLRWVGLNYQVTVKELLEETINDESKPREMRVGAAATYQQMMQMQDPRLQQVVETRNPVPEIDVDIILDQSFDMVNVQQEQFALLMQFAQGSSDIDIIELIELSQLRGKDELIEKIEKRRADAAQAAGNMQQIQAADAQAKARKTMADAFEKEQKGIQTGIENQLLIASPPQGVTQVSV